MTSQDGAIPGWNLGLRLILELGSLGALGWAGWQAGGVLGIVLAVLLPFGAAVAWGTFAVPGDPSRSGKAPVPVPGAVRLLVEYLVLGGACVALALAGATVAAVAFVALNIVHIAFATSRIRWLLRV